MWLTRRQMSELFATSSGNVLIHLKNVYDAEELIEPATDDARSGIARLKTDLMAFTPER